MKPYLAWPDNNCGVGRTSLWGALDPDLMRDILRIVPTAYFTPTFSPKRRYESRRIYDLAAFWEYEFKIRTERIGDRSAERSAYEHRLGFYVDLDETDVEQLRAVFDIGPRGGPCEIPRSHQLT